MIYVTGDLHGDLDRFQAPALKKLRRGDTLIVCGDFGFLWEGGKAEQRVLKKLGRKRYNIAFVDGVHENHPLLQGMEVTQWNGGKVHNLCGRLYHLMRGQVYQIEGKTIFTLGGGENPDPDARSQRLEGCLPSIEDLYEANRNLQKVDYRVDYVVTHDCSGTVRNFLNMGPEEEYNHLSAFLNEAAKVIEFKRWYFGCRHLDKPIPPRYVAVFHGVHPLD